MAMLHSRDSGFGSACTSFDPDEYGHRRAKKRTRNAGDPKARPRAKAFDRVVKLFAVRDRSEKELRDRLARDGYEASEIDGAIGRAKRCGLLDDQRFARAFVRARVAACKGPVVIARDLKKHGILLDDVPGWPDEFEYGEEDQFSRAVALLEKNPPRSKDQWSGAYRKLVSRGFPSTVASRATRAWCESARSGSEAGE